jgi:hypothetical protein
MALGVSAIERGFEITRVNSLGPPESIIGAAGGGDGTGGGLNIGSLFGAPTGLGSDH